MVAICSDNLPDRFFETIARGAYQVAARVYPEDLIELRHRARVIEPLKECRWCRPPASAARQRCRRPGPPRGSRSRASASRRHGHDTGWFVPPWVWPTEWGLDSWYFDCRSSVAPAAGRGARGASLGHHALGRDPAQEKPATTGAGRRVRSRDRLPRVACAPVLGRSCPRWPPHGDHRTALLSVLFEDEGPVVARSVYRRPRQKNRPLHPHSQRKIRNPGWGHTYAPRAHRRPVDGHQLKKAPRGCRRTDEGTALFQPHPCCDVSVRAGRPSCGDITTDRRWARASRGSWGTARA
jgi:hypothetical protein